MPTITRSVSCLANEMKRLGSKAGFGMSSMMQQLRRIFPYVSGVARTIEARYEGIFSIEEIRDRKILQLFFGASLFYFFLTFYNWVLTSLATVEKGDSAACWPYFRDCYKLYFFHETSVDDSRGIFYMVLFGVMLLVAYCMLRRRWNMAHALLSILFLWEALVVFVLSYAVAEPYYYYHLILTAVLLFFPYKEYFLKLAFVLLYFMSATIKFDPGWVVGTYFSTLKSGLPLVPKDLLPIATNAVIFLQVIGCWFLLSRRQLLQRGAVVLFTIFHLYSAILIFYMFPAVALPALLILFGPLYSYTPSPFNRKSIFGWLFIVLIGMFQLLGFVTPGDRRLGMEGNKFGMFMFEANHQCQVRLDIIGTMNDEPTTWEAPIGSACTGIYYCKVGESITKHAGKTEHVLKYESAGPSTRCDPYEWWAQMNRRCETNRGIERIAVRMDHSINGGPFYSIVDVQNICALDYLLFRHNDWIKLPPGAPIVGYPVTDVERD